MSRKIEISPFGSLLVYKKEYKADDVRSIIQEHNLRGLRIFAQLKDERLSDLDFLCEFSFLEALSITSTDDDNFEFLKNLKKLKELTIIIAGKNKINLSNQECLENLTIQWRKGKIGGLDKCHHISTLCLVDYTENDLTPLNSLHNLMDLKIKTASINNIKGIENFIKLNSLLLGNCKKLSNLNGLEYLINLKYLSFDLCPQIKNFNKIGYLPNLENLQITDCKEVETIKFIEKLPSIKRFTLLGSSDVLDGDILPAKNIKEVFYKHRKHYNFKIENQNYDDIIKKNLEKIKNNENRN